MIEQPIKPVFNKVVVLNQKFRKGFLDLEHCNMNAVIRV